MIQEEQDDNLFCPQCGCESFEKKVGKKGFFICLNGHCEHTFNLEKAREYIALTKAGKVKEQEFMRSIIEANRDNIAFLMKVFSGFPSLVESIGINIYELRDKVNEELV